MQSAGNVVGYVNAADQVIKSWGPLFAVVIVGLALSSLFFYYKLWPRMEKQMEARNSLLASREEFLQTQVNQNQARVDSITKDFHTALERLTNVFQAGFERLFAQGAANAGKLDAIIDLIPAMEDAERRWKQALEGGRKLSER